MLLTGANQTTSLGRISYTKIATDLLAQGAAHDDARSVSARQTTPAAS
jgi:hypothetical protein